MLLKEKNSDKTNRQDNNEIEIPDGLKVLLGVFKEKTPDIKLTVREIKKAEDKI